MSGILWKFLEQKPVVLDGETHDKKATSFAAVLADERWTEKGMNKHMQQLNVEWTNDYLKNKPTRARRMLIVTTADGPRGQTMIYFNLAHPNTDQEAKRLIGRYFAHFGEHIQKRAMASTHLFNYRDDKKIKSWRLPELPEDVSSSGAAKTVEDLSTELAAASNEAIVLREPGDLLLKRIETQKHEINGNILELENKLQALEWKGADQLGVKMSADEISSRKRELENGAIPKDEGELGFLTYLQDGLEEENFKGEHEGETECIRKELQGLRLDRDYEEDRLQQFVVCIMDGDPSEPFYRVNYIREHEREALIKDRLSEEIRSEIERYSSDNSNHTKILQRITKATLDTELVLMQEGSIPDFTINRRNKSKFIERARTVVKQETGTEPPMPKWCNDHLEQNIQNTERCQQCKKKGIEYYWDELKDAFLSKGQKKDSDDSVPFCSLQCRFDYICSPACPKCGACEKHLLRKEEGESEWPNPGKMLEYGCLSQKIATLRAQPARGKEFEEQIEEQIGDELQIFERMEKELYLPILRCKECKEECEPRSPFWLYLTYNPFVPSTPFIKS